MSAFYRLPVELLTIIAKCVTEQEQWSTEAKALRLTHPHFANLDYLNAHLFHSVNFNATPEGIDRMKADPLAGLKPFVRKIIFLPSQYSTGMTYFHFRRIVIKQCSFYCPTDCRLTDHPRRGGETEMESAWAKDPLFSPGELFASYQEYHRKAQAAQALLTNGSLQVWTNAIRQLPNVKTFEFGKHKERDPACETRSYSLRPSAQGSNAGPEERPSSHDLTAIPQLYEQVLCIHAPGMRDCKINPSHPHDEDGDLSYYGDESHSDTPYHSSSVCELNAIRTQATLIEPVSLCIKNAGAQPESIIFASTLTTFELECLLPPNLRSLTGLSSIRSLEWRTEVFKDGTRNQASPLEQNTFLLALLRECRLLLQNLRIVADIGNKRRPFLQRHTIWPPEQFSQLPLSNLRQLHLTGTLQPRTLTLWFKSMPCLEDLTLLHVSGPNTNGLKNWRFVLDAIRNHRSLLRVRLELANEWLLDKSKLTVAVRTSTRNSTSTSTERGVQMDFGDGWDNKYDLKKEGENLCRWLEGEEDCEWDPRLDIFSHRTTSFYSV
jgi:hypothetical protein